MAADGVENAHHGGAVVGALMNHVEFQRESSQKKMCFF